MLVDTLIGGLVAAPLVLGDLPVRGSTEPETGELWMAACIWAAVALRRIRPLPVLAASTGLGVTAILTGGSAQPGAIVALVLVVHTVAADPERPVFWLVAVASTTVLIYLAATLVSTAAWWAPQNLALVAWLGLAVAVGDATRSRHAYVTEVEERAHRAEQTRSSEVRRRIIEERMRIARELHDVVSHNIAVISVQAGAARHVLRERPEVVDSSLEHIRAASDTVLKELSSIVGILRDSSDLEASSGPTRGLAHLPELLRSADASGLRVKHEEIGSPRDLPAVVDLAAYRILQESLTNARKHGIGPAWLRIEYAAGHITLEIRNQIAFSGAVDGPQGYGLVGMHERAQAAGGRLNTQLQSDDNFCVRAVLPAVNA
ncbi:two-component sensor histidine kinase [Kineosporia sp. NBRC 101731]|nr:two-component sensor histidine kinase [Kineosporia sp. NBRC 101731]